jgi:hypothetical protein
MPRLPEISSSAKQFTIKKQRTLAAISTDPVAAQKRGNARAAGNHAAAPADDLQRLTFTLPRGTAIAVVRPTHRADWSTWRTAKQAN